MGDPVLAGAADAVLAKIAARLPDGREEQLFHATSQVHRATPRYPQSGLVDAVRRACWQEHALAILYGDTHGGATERGETWLSRPRTR